MTALREPARTTRPAPVRAPRRAPAMRDVRASGVLFWLCVSTVVITGAVMVWPDVIPMTALVVPLLLGSLLLGPRQLPWFVVGVLVALMLVLTRQTQITIRTVMAVAIMFLLSFIILLTSFRRSRLGVAGVLGESMLVDLRDRILGQGGIPVLPHGWYAESALRSAGGTPFAGDFIVATTDETGERLEVVVVDVSGKGEQAGTRALLLSGAFGGLLTALHADRFLPAANNYLLRQGWEEGFATAVHLSLHLASGDFEVRTAGHPPAVQLASGSGRWTVLESEGPILGLIEGAEFPAVTGTVRRGDALLLYTDGMVETRRRDIGLGIDKLIGQAERLLRGEFDGGAARLVDSLGSQDDDRALLLVHRR